MKRTLRFLSFILLYTGISIQVTFSQDRPNASLSGQSSTKKDERAAKHWANVRINSTIIDQSGQVFEGQLLYISDTILYQFISREPYRPELLESSTLIFKVNDVQQIQLYRKGRVGNSLIKSLVLGSIGTLGMTFLTEESAWGRGFNFLGSAIWVMPASLLTGTIVGSGKKIDVVLDRQHGDSSFEVLLPMLNKYALFPENLPAEFMEKKVVLYQNEAIPSKAIQTFPKITREELPLGKGLNQQASTIFKSPAYISKYHFTIGPGSSVQLMDRIYQQSMLEQSYSPIVLNEPFLMNNTWLSFGLSYRVAEHLRLSMQFKPRYFYGNSFYRKHLENDFYVVSSRSILGSTMALNGEYIFKPVHRLLSSRFEALITGGIISNALSIDQYLSFDKITGTGSGTYDSFNTNTKKALWGINGGIEFDYYFTRNFSIYVKSMVNYYPTFQLPSITLSSEYLNRTQTLQPIDVNGSIIDFSFGLYIHY
ncbi:MAG: hypothetical protein ACERKD_06580 [Prolixibacteraceae bacterium]